GLPRAAARLPDLGVRPAAQCAVETRPRRGRERALEYSRLVSVVPSVDAALERGDGAELVDDSAFPPEHGTPPLRSARLSAGAALRDARRIRLPRPRSWNGTRRPDPRLRRGADRRRPLLPGDSLLGSRCGAETRVVRVPRLRRTAARRPIRRSRGVVRVMATAHHGGRGGKIPNVTRMTDNAEMGHWGARAARLYDDEYARRYFEYDDQAV